MVPSPLGTGACPASLQHERTSHIQQLTQPAGGASPNSQKQLNSFWPRKSLGTSHTWCSQSSSSIDVSASSGSVQRPCHPGCALTVGIPGTTGHRACLYHHLLLQVWAVSTRGSVVGKGWKESGGPKATSARTGWRWQRS